MNVHPLEFPYYFGCLIAVMIAGDVHDGLVLTAADPAGERRAEGPLARRRRRRSPLSSPSAASVGYFLMWLSFRPPFPTLSLVPGPLAVVLAAFAVALAFYSGFMAVWARRTLGKEWTFEARLLDAHRLVTAGPYAIVRHPIYAAMLGLWIATALAVARPWGILIGLPFMLVGTVMRVKIEDALLRGAFGDTFEAWKKETPAVIPFAPR